MKIDKTVGIVIMIILLASVVTALPAIDFNQFYGDVKGINDGTIVVVKVNDKQVGKIVVKDGKYGYDTLLKIPGKSSKGANEGEMVEFYVSNEFVSSTSFRPGKATRLDLALEAAEFCGDNICNEDACGCKIDCGVCPEDKDEDGVVDVEDRVVVRKEKIIEKLKNVEPDKVKIKIDGKEEILNEYIGTKEVSIGENDRPILRFDFNFDTKILNLEKVAVEKQSSLEDKGFVIVKGLENEVGTKTIYLDKLNLESKSVCIKDAPVDVIGQLSANCNGESEIYLKCDGVVKEGYICNAFATQFEVSGVKNSAAREVTQEEEAGIEAAQEPMVTPETPGDTPTPSTGEQSGPVYACGDGIDNDGDGYVDTSDPGCTNSRDNDESNVCVENWQCGQWDACNAGVRTRRCSDVNNCNTGDGPGEMITCEANIVENLNNGIEQTVFNEIITREEVAGEFSQLISEEQEFFPEEEEEIFEEPELQPEVFVEEEELEAPLKSKPVKSKAIIYISFLIMAVLGLMLGFMFFNKPGPLPAPPIIARKEEKILRRELKTLEEDDILFDIDFKLTKETKKVEKKQDNVPKKVIKAEKKQIKVVKKK
jgi:hypothetical protein